MLRTVVAAVATFGAVCSVATAQAKPREVIELKASGPWNIDYGENTCSLRRTFYVGEDEARIEFQGAVTSGVMSLRIASKLVNDGSFESLVTVAFGPDDLGTTKRAALAGTTADGTPALLIYSIPLEASWLPPANVGPAKLASWPTPTADQISHVRAQATELRLVQGKRILVFKHGALTSPMAALDKCLEDEAKELNAEVGLNAPGSTAPTPRSNPVMWLSGADFPKEMTGTGQSGVVAFRLVVASDGIPEKCTIVSMDGAEAFRELTCSLLMKRATFNPAKDKDGVPIRGIYSNQVRWLNAF